MKKKTFIINRSFILLCVVLVFINAAATGDAPKSQLFEIRVYHFKDTIQERALDAYLGRAFLPALHRAGIDKAGVFKVIANDTLADKMLYVLLPFKSLEQFQQLTAKLARDASYQSAASAYINTNYKGAAFARMESILLEAFPMAPQLTMPELSGPRNERVYELRSYESATEKYHQNKVNMFSTGGEIELFERLQFNAVFYGSVISGSRMPNLMYMTSFENKTERDAHWMAFSTDPAWKKLSAMPEYQNNVSHIDIVFLRPTSYSDL